MNTVCVCDKSGNDRLFGHPEGYDIEIIYREDQSLRIQAFSLDPAKEVITLAEYACGEWSCAYMAGEAG
jgi:hypothetical protein